MQLEFDAFSVIFPTSLSLGLKISPLVDKAFQKVPIKILICYPSGPLRLVLGKKSYSTPTWARHILGGMEGKSEMV